MAPASSGKVHWCEGGYDGQSVSGSIQGQAGQCLEQPGLLEGVPAHGQVLELNDLCCPKPKPFWDSLIHLISPSPRLSTGASHLPLLEKEDALSQICSLSPLLPECHRFVITGLGG